MAKSPQSPPAVKPAKPARAKREPSKLVLAAHALSQLERANARRDKLYNRINDLDARIDELQKIAQSQFDAIQKVLDGGAPAAPAVTVGGA